MGEIVALTPDQLPPPPPLELRIKGLKLRLTDEFN